MERCGLLKNEPEPIGVISYQDLFISSPTGSSTFWFLFPMSTEKRSYKTVF